MPGKPISARVVSEPVLVKKGAHVTIVYSTPTIRLRTVGVALEDGEHGALIPVKNITSGVVIHAEVQGKNEVVVPSVVGEEEQADDDEYDNNDHQNYYSDDSTLPCDGNNTDDECYFCNRV
jgi:hypothetical protein